VFISIIIATRNRQALLAQTLDALAMQRWPERHGEIIVADNGSSDETAAIVAAAAARANRLPIHYLYLAEPGKSAAVNAALHQAQGDVLAFTDDDVIPEPSWLEQLAEAFQDPDIDFVAGRILPRWESAVPAWMSTSLYGVIAVADGGEAQLRIRAGEQEHPMTIGANMAVRASVIRRLGGLRHDLGKLGGTLRTGEDHEFFLRMLHSGCQGVYEPSAVVHHLVPRARLNRSYFRRWFYQNGRDVALLERPYPPKVRLLGVARYRWRAAVLDVLIAARAAATFDAAARFAAVVRLIWLAGHVRESWFGASRTTGLQATPAVQGR
jgi:glycosyltransferase involved in cell wall biosynthesis